MQKASELHKSLSATLPIEEVERIVDGAIERGDVENDITIDEPDADMVKSLVQDIKDELEGVGASSLAKSDVPSAFVDVEDDYIDVSTTLESIVKSSNGQARLIKSLSDDSADNDERIAKSLVSLSELTEYSLAQTSSLAKSISALVENQTKIMETLRIPVQPRSIREEASIITHPGETTIKSDGSSAAVRDIPTVHALITKAKEEQRSLMKSEDPNANHRQFQLAHAVAALESGVDPAKVMAEYALGA